MAEDSPQDSLGHQEASEDFNDITNEKFNNSMKENTILDKNQCGEEYDLTVIVPHGIGRQKPGDTFELMYNSIKNDFIIACEEEGGTSHNIIPEIVEEYFESDAGEGKSDKAIHSDAKRGKRIGVDIEIPPLGENKCRRIALRESYWHKIKSDTSNSCSGDEISVEELNKSPNEIEKSASQGTLILGVFHIIFLKLLQFRLSTISFVLIVGSILNLAGSGNQYDIFKMVPQEKWEEFNKAISIPVYLIVVFVLIVALICFASPLYRQIKSCSAGFSSNQAKKVSNDIKESLSKSRELIVVAHSMGGYMSYEALNDRDLSSHLKCSDGKDKKISLVGLGSGLGPMKIIEKVKKNNIIVNLALILLLIFLLFLYAFLWSALYLNILTFVFDAWMGSRVLWWSDNDIKGTPIIFGYNLEVIPPECSIFICIESLVLMRICIEKFLYPYYSIVGNNDKFLNRFPHREFYYSSDFVGNTSRFVYSKNTGQELLGNPANGTLRSLFLANIFRRFIYSHDLGYYFQNARLLQFLEWEMFRGIDSKYYGVKDRKPAILQTFYCICFFAALVYFYMIYVCRYKYDEQTSLVATVLFTPALIGSCWFVYSCVYFVFSIILYYRRGKGKDYIQGSLETRTLLDKGRMFFIYRLFQFIMISGYAALVSLYSRYIMEFLINCILNFVIALNFKNLSLVAILLLVVIMCFSVYVFSKKSKKVDN